MSEVIAFRFVCCDDGTGTKTLLAWSQRSGYLYFFANFHDMAMKKLLSGVEQLADKVRSLLSDQDAFDTVIEAARAAHNDLMPDLDALVRELLPLLEPQQ